MRAPEKWPTVCLRSRRPQVRFLPGAPWNHILPGAPHKQHKRESAQDLHNLITEPARLQPHWRNRPGPVPPTTGVASPTGSPRADHRDGTSVSTGAVGTAGRLGPAPKTALTRCRSHRRMPTRNRHLHPQAFTPGAPTHPSCGPVGTNTKLLGLPRGDLRPDSPAAKDPHDASQFRLPFG